MAPKWSRPTLSSSWPATIRVMVVATPRRGTPQAAATTKMAPYSPPTQAYQGRAREAAMSGLAWSRTARMPRAAVPTAKETKAAFTGEPTAVIILALVGA